MPYSTALSGGLTENSERIRGKDRRGGIYRAGCDDTAETCGVQTEDTELREQGIITREIHRTRSNSMIDTARILPGGE